jgi:hypothetical protein
LIALYYNYNIRFPKHKFFSKTDIKFHNLQIKYTITDPGPENFFFYENNKLKNIDEILFSMNNEKALNILRDCFIIKGDCIQSLSDNDVVIHIRSGDIFCTDIHPLFWQPPLSFYVNLINTHKFDNIHLVSENKLNPCVGKLLKLFPILFINSSIVSSEFLNSKSLL